MQCVRCGAECKDRLCYGCQDGKPRTFDVLVAEINASGFFIDDHAPKVSRPKKRNRMPEINGRELTIVIALLERKATAININGAPYAVSKVDGGWKVQSLREPSDYTIEAGQCSCPDCVYRAHKCKHLEAVEHAVAEGRLSG